MLFVMVGQGGAYRGPRLHVAVSASDTGSRWTLDLEDGHPPRAAVATENAAPGGDVVSVTGAAEDVLLFLWSRHGADAVGLAGDDAATGALLAWVAE